MMILLFLFLRKGNMSPYLMSYLWFIGGDKSVHHSLTVWLSAGSLACQGLALPISGTLVLKIGFRPIIIFSLISNR